MNTRTNSTRNEPGEPTPNATPNTNRTGVSSSGNNVGDRISNHNIIPDLFLQNPQTANMDLPEVIAIDSNEPSSNNTNIHDTPNDRATNPNASHTNVNANSFRETTPNDFMSHLHDLFRATSDLNRSATTATATTSSEITDDGISNSAIMITINYVFSDENEPSRPNRSGTLVLTLPNNAANRTPRVLEQFIRLGTHMAFTSIVNNGLMHKGVSKEKFEQFPQKSLDQIHDKTCSICLDQFISLNAETCYFETDDTLSSIKRRKLNNETISPVSTNESMETPKKPLDDSPTEYSHVPVEMPCGHIFGRSCLYEWLKNHSTCPLCRKSIVTEEPTRDNTAGSSNIEFGIDNLWNSEGSGVRLVSRTGFDEMVSLITSRLGTSLDNESLANTNGNNSTDDTTTSSGSGSGSGSVSSLANLFETTTLPTASGFITGMPPPPPINIPSMASQPSTSRDARSSSHGIFSNILTYFRRRESNSNTFPSGVFSRRNANGTVNTTVSGDFHSGSSVIDLPPPGSGIEAPSQGHRVLRRFLTASEFANLRNSNPVLYNHLVQPSAVPQGSTVTPFTAMTTGDTRPRVPSEIPETTPSTNHRRTPNFYGGSSVSVEDEILDYLNLRSLTDDPQPDPSAE